MPTHAHFEELCVLATSGQLSAVESDVLNRHLVECDNCRSFLKDAQFLSDRVIPQTLHVSRTEARVPAGMRERFLQRAASQGLKIEAGPPVAAPPLIADAESSQHVPVTLQWSSWPSRAFGSLRPSRIWALAGLACAACFLLGLLMRMPSGGQGQGGSTARTLQSPGAQSGPIATPVNPDSDHVRALAAERERLTKQIADLAQQVQAVEIEKEHAEEAWQQRLTAVNSDAARDHDNLSQQTATLSARAADLQSQLDIVRQQQLFAEADLKNARTKTSEYSARLDLLQTQLRAQEGAPLPTSSEVSSLVAARNLHIIDVYDSSANGKRGRAFGRVFYVEGRSLVFYAYDLSVAQAQKNITFHLWGEKAGHKETTLSLGVLHDDDPQEGRWALTCNDPNLLAKINSVYVTAESSGKQHDAPHGPRVLYAYFGAAPNHP